MIALLVLVSLLLGAWIGATYVGTKVLAACQLEGQVFFEAFTYRERLKIDCNSPQTVRDTYKRMPENQRN